jgi:hypothetical protein
MTLILILTLTFKESVGVYNFQCVTLSPWSLALYLLRYEIQISCQFGLQVRQILACASDLKYSL